MGQPFLCLDHHTAGRLCSVFRSGRACWALCRLTSTDKNWIEWFELKLRFSYFCKSKLEKSTERGLLGGVGVGVWRCPRRISLGRLCDPCPRDSHERKVCLALSPIVTEAQNIIDFTFVEPTPRERETLAYTKYTSLSGKIQLHGPNKYSFCYTISCFLSLVHNPLTYQDEMIKY